MAAKSYWEKLKDPRWQRKRLEILERDGFTCRFCFSQENTLHVHHGYYEKGLEPWEYDSGTLMTLCDECHKEVQQILLELHKSVAMLDSPFSVDALLRISTLMRDMIGKRKPKSLDDQRDIAERIVQALSYGTFSSEPWWNLSGPPRPSPEFDYELDAQISSGIGVSA